MTTEERVTLKAELALLRRKAERRRDMPGYSANVADLDARIAEIEARLAQED